MSLLNRITISNVTSEETPSCHQLDDAYKLGHTRRGTLTNFFSSLFSLSGSSSNLPTPSIVWALCLSKCRSLLVSFSWFSLFPSFLPTGEMAVEAANSSTFPPLTWGAMC